MPPLLRSMDGHRPHPLHALERSWPETNCYVDLWIEVLHAHGHEPTAALAFTVAQDFEGDQFTFFKFPPDDIEALFGLAVQELAIYDSLEAHVAEQLRRDRLVLVEVDSFYLPDTQGVSYRREHTKTTIGVNELDAAARRLGYFHNAGYFRLEGDDFDGVLRRAPGFAEQPDLLFPYVEFVKRLAPALEGAALAEASLARLRHHLRRRPSDNPVARFRAAFPRHLETLGARPMGYFHLYAFNLLRQLGANAELLGSYLRWLDPQTGLGVEPAAASFDEVSGAAKALQFQLARGVSRRKFADQTALLDTLERGYEAGMGVLADRIG